MTRVSKRQQAQSVESANSRTLTIAVLPIHLHTPELALGQQSSPLFSLIPNFNEDVDNGPGAMVGSKIVGSLTAGERKYDNEGTLFWRCVSFWCFYRRERGNDIRASRHDRERSHQSCGRMWTGILARARRALSSVRRSSGVPAGISSWP